MTVTGCEVYDFRAELEIDATENKAEVAQLAQEHCRQRLRAGEDIAFSATNLTGQFAMTIAIPEKREVVVLPLNLISGRLWGRPRVRYFNGRQNLHQVDPA